MIKHRVRRLAIVASLFAVLLVTLLTGRETSASQEIPGSTTSLAGVPQITYTRFERTSLDYLYATYCANFADSYALDWGQINASGTIVSSTHQENTALSGCIQGVLFFSKVTDGQHLFITITARGSPGTTVSQFDLYPNSTHLLNQCSVQTDGLSALIRDPRYRWDTAAGVSCAFVDPADPSIPPTPTPSPVPNIAPNPPTLVTPTSDAVFNSAAVTLQVQDAGDPDNGPRSARNFLFHIAKSDGSWSTESGWVDNASWGVTLPSQGSYTWQAQSGDGAATSTIAGPRALFYVVAVPVPPPTPPPPTTSGQPWNVPYFSQLDSRWSRTAINHPTNMTDCNSTIGNIGCALTSLTMLSRYYGVDHTPATMNACLGNVACPLVWGSQIIKSCSNNKVRFVSWPAFSYQSLQQELVKGPVILQLQKSTGYLHFIVVLGGSGTNPANYLVNDPGLRSGARVTLSSSLANFRGYSPSSMRIYTGTPAPLPASLATREELPTLQAPTLMAGETITGTLDLYRNTESEMVLELAAQSSTGAVSHMRVWTESNPSDVWQPFAQYVNVPLDSAYYVQYRDAAGNTSAVISTGIPQATAVDQPSYQVNLPSVMR